MVRKNFSLVFSTLLLVFGGVLAVCAQSLQEAEDVRATPMNRAQMLRSLGLSRSQIDRIRAVNREYQPPVRESNQRLKAANLALDEAIYGGEATEATVRERLREAQTAHSEWLKNRTAHETAISRTLNPEQLQRFRQLRLQNRQTNRIERRLSDRTQPSAPRLNQLRRRIRSRSAP